MTREKNKLHKIVLFVSALAAAFTLIFGASLLASGQTISLASTDEGAVDASVHDMFPVAELGNCANKNECKSYCNEPANMDACIVFAKDHGLMTATDATRAGKFGKLVRAGNGPGQCDSPEGCDTYCRNLSHLDECTAFAEKNGFKGDQYEHGKKIQAFLKKGGTTPGNCQTKEECQTYCGDFGHAKECFDFSQKTEITQNGGREETSSTTLKMAKFAELAQNGETPGGCTTKDACEKYCSDQSHREECVNFGVKVGFIKPNEAARIKESGGKGPGGCDSSVACRNYCNESSHHEECFNFSEERGFNNKFGGSQEALVRTQQAFLNASPRVKECLKETIDAKTLADIQSGKQVSNHIGDQVRGCFEKFAGTTTIKRMGSGEGGRMTQPSLLPQTFEGILRSAPPEVIACLKEKFPNGLPATEGGTQQLGTEIKDKIRGCFESFHPTMKPVSGAAPSEGAEGSKNEDLNGGVRQPPSPPVGGFVNMSPEVITCIRGTIGEDNFQKIQTTPASLELIGVIRTCIEKTSSPSTQGVPLPASTSEPMTFLEKFIGAALLPARWMLGK